VADDGLVAAERALFAALAARDRVALDRLADASLVVRVPGQPDVDRAAFLQAAAATPGEILGVDGERLAAHRAGDAGIVSGVQVARLRVDGRTVEDRATFVDVFVRRDGAWRLAFALYVPH
jgi:ketosteroid isomerase-like protein